MRFAALAADYDGTLAHDGVVSRQTIAALERLKASSRKLLLVTGRELADLQGIFSRLDLFDLCVMENGATLYFPSEKKEQPLADPPSEQFVAALRRRSVAELSVGRVIVATREPETDKVLDAIRSLRLELQVIFNKGALMVLPSGINKASGLAAALNLLGLSPHNVVGVGDAENDHAFLAACECGVAVGNALPSVKERADLVTKGSRGEGVQEIVDWLVGDDLRARSRNLRRHDILLGRIPDGDGVLYPVYGKNLLISGDASDARSRLANLVVSRLKKASYQVCVVDPEGHYAGARDAVVLGETGKAPTVETVLAVLEKPDCGLVLNLSALAPVKRPHFFQTLATRLEQFAGTKARPHWLVIDEAQQLLPHGKPAPRGIHSLSVALIASQPGAISVEAAASADLIAVGSDSGEVARAWSQASGIRAEIPSMAAPAGGATLWRQDSPSHAVSFTFEDCPEQVVPAGSRHS